MSDEKTPKKKDKKYLHAVILHYDNARAHNI